MNIPKSKIYWDVITTYSNKTRILKRANFWISEIFDEIKLSNKNKSNIVECVFDKLTLNFLNSKFDNKDYKHCLIDCFNFFVNLYSWNHKSSRKKPQVDTVRLLYSVLGNSEDKTLSELGLQNIDAVVDEIKDIVKKDMINDVYDLFYQWRNMSTKKLIDNKITQYIISSFKIRVISQTLNKVITNSKFYESYCACNPLYLSNLIEYNQNIKNTNSHVCIVLDEQKYYVPKDMQLCTIQLSMEYLDVFKFCEELLYKTLYKNGLSEENLKYICKNIHEESINDNILRTACGIVNSCNLFLTGDFVFNKSIESTENFKDIKQQFLTIFLHDLNSCNVNSNKCVFKILDYIKNRVCLVSEIYGLHMPVGKAKYLSGKDWKQKKLKISSENKDHEARAKESNDIFCFTKIEQSLNVKALSDVLYGYADFDFSNTFGYGDVIKYRENGDSGIRVLFGDARSYGITLRDLTLLSRFENKDKADNKAFISSKGRFQVAPTLEGMEVKNYLFNANFPDFTIMCSYVSYIGLMKDKELNKAFKELLDLTPFENVVLGNKLEFLKTLFTLVLDKNSWDLYKKLVKKILLNSQSGKFDYNFKTDSRFNNILITYKDHFSSFHLCSNPSLRIIRPIKKILGLMRFELNQFCCNLINEACYKNNELTINSDNWSFSSTGNKIGIRYTRLENLFFYKYFTKCFKYIIDEKSDNPKFMFTFTLQNFDNLREYALKFISQIEHIIYVAKKDKNLTDSNYLLLKFIEAFKNDEDDDCPFDLNLKIDLQNLKNVMTKGSKNNEILWYTLLNLCLPTIESQKTDDVRYLSKTPYSLSENSLSNNAMDIDFISDDVKNKVQDFCKKFIQLAMDPSITFQSGIKGLRFEGLNLRNALLIPETIVDKDFVQNTDPEIVETIIYNRIKKLETHLTYSVLRGLFFSLINSFIFRSDNKDICMNFFIPKGKVFWKENKKNKSEKGKINFSSDVCEERLELFDYGFINPKSDDEIIGSISDENLMKNKPRFCLDF